MSERTADKGVIKVITYDDSLTVRRVTEKTIDGLRHIAVNEASPTVRAARGELVRDPEGGCGRPSVVKVISFDDQIAEKSVKEVELAGLVVIQAAEATPAFRKTPTDWVTPPGNGTTALKVITYDDSLTQKHVKQTTVDGLIVITVAEASPAVRAARA